MAFSEAASSDARRSKSKSLGPLDGIPYTIKDSMKYKDMTCSNGSPAFAKFVANDDSFVVEQLRKAGAVCIGRTNSPPMMASGMHRGLHGRAESPYNLEYLTAAFSSGSSNGSATSTAASFAAFGLGSETVSSGRSPASNNGLVAYTPSRTVISTRGVWPLYPTCDVIVPHTRSVEDMLSILDVLTLVDSIKKGDFWREQTFVDIPFVPRPNSYLELKNGARGSLRGKRIGVPKVYIGKEDSKAKPTTVSPDVIDLWDQTRANLENMGAEVIESDFPLVANYEDDSATGETNNIIGFKPGWNAKERSELVAYMWDDFLKANGGLFCTDLASIDGSQMFPRPEGYLPDRYMEQKNFINYPGLPEVARNRHGKTIWEMDGIAEALPALEAQRERDLELWMDNLAIDVVVFPANGDVGRADLEHNDESARHALRNGVKYSNGNRAIRHMGVPTVSVCMGTMKQSKMPLNLTFAGKHGQDMDLLKYAYAFEQQTKRRVPPPLTPALESDEIPIKLTSYFDLHITSAKKIGEHEVELKGDFIGTPDKPVQLQVSVDGKEIPESSIEFDEGWSFRATYIPFQPKTPLYGGVGQVVNKVMIVVFAKAGTGRTAGKMVLIDQNS